MMGYEGFKKEILEAPDTWLVALAIVAMEECLRRGVLRPGGLEQLAANVSQRFYTNEL